MVKTNTETTTVIPNIISMVEISEAKPEQIDHVVKGARELRNLTRKLCLAIAPGRQTQFVDCMRKVQNAAPGEPWDIFPAIKTATFLEKRKFDYVQAWEQVVADIKHHIQYSKITKVFLENETSMYTRSLLWNYWNNDPKINWPRFEQCLALLPKEIEYWWYPCTSSGNKDFSLQLCETVKRCIPKVKFVTAQFQRPAPNKEWPPEFMKIRSIGPCIPIMYNNVPAWSWSWPDDRIKAGIETAWATKPCEAVIHYPGYTIYPDSCRALAKSFDVEVKTIEAEVNQ